MNLPLSTLRWKRNYNDQKTHKERSNLECEVTSRLEHSPSAQKYETVIKETLERDCTST